jgi:hypothetical protein
MPSHCKTCPFGPNGDLILKSRLMAKLLETNQLCHQPRFKGQRETHLCRGSRDYQLEMYTRLGVLNEATDACWDATQRGQHARN